MRTVSEREQKVLDMIETARAKRAQVPRPAHHHGPRRRRQGHPDADRGAAGARPSRRRPWTRWATPRLVSAGGVELAMTTDSFVVKPIRFPGRLDRRAGGERDGQRPRRRRGPAAGDHAGAWCWRRAWPRRSCGPRSSAIAAAAAAAGVEVVAGDTKVVERGHADAHVPHHDRAWARATRGRALSPGRAAAGRPICWCRGRWAPTGWRSCWRAASSSSTRRIESDTRSLWPMVDALLDAAGGRTCAACATRRAAAWRRC